MWTILAAILAQTAAGPVIVALDVNPTAPGIQRRVLVPRGTSTVPVQVFLFDPSGTRAVVSIGCQQCALFQGIALGHSRPTTPTAGQVTGIVPATGTPLAPGNQQVAYQFGVLQAFDGPQIEFMEDGLSPAALPAAPAAPLFTADIHLQGAQTGDVFSLFLMDTPAVLGAGAFSTGQPFGFDTGGDAVPDGTRTTLGLDPDQPVPVPPAAFAVDYQDGPLAGGGATIVVTNCYPDCNGDDLLNLADFGCFQSRFATGSLFADCDNDGMLTLADFGCFQTQFALGCP